MATTDLVTRAELEEYIGIPTPSATADQTRLDNLVTRGSEEIKQRTGRSIIHTALSEIHDGRARDYVILRDAPIKDKASVTLWESLDQTWDSTTQIAAADFMADLPRGRIIRFDSVLFLEAKQSIRVDYTAGYGATTNAIPMWIKEIVLRLCAWRYERAKGQSITSKSAGDVATTFHGPQDEAKFLRELLAPLMRHRVA